MWGKLDRLFLGVEWKLSLIGILLGALGSFALPAWALRTANMFSQYAPFSWVAAGFAGLLLYAFIVWLIGVGRSKLVRSKYDARFMQETGGVDPLARVFEGKRIYLNDFVLPSNAQVIGKTFVDCEIVGPANMYFEFDNSVDDVQPGLVDAVALSGERQFFNGVLFRNCKFRGCTFHRVTLFFEPKEALRISRLDWLNWISPMPPSDLLTDQEKPSLIEDQSDQSQPETEEEKPH
jgi:hypothetical protein